MGCINRTKVNTPSGFPGQKSMSSARMPTGSNHSTGKAINRSTVNTPKSWPGQKSISAQKGVVSAKQTSGMVTHGGDRVGAGKKTFSSGNFKQGPCKIGSGKKGY
jgi:hypothetical protein